MILNGQISSPTLPIPKGEPEGVACSIADMDLIKKISNLAQNAAFPRFCFSCKKEGSLLCEECFVHWQPGTFQIVDEDRHVHSWQYADPITRQLICSWKYHYDQSAWKILKSRLQSELVTLRHFVHIHNIEAIVPVPLHSHRMCERGFDQVVMIAEFLSEELELPVENLLKRSFSTGHQAEREEADRIEAMKKSPFKLTTPQLSKLTTLSSRAESRDLPDSILLIDDVWTTGATIKAAAEAIEGGGIDKVWKYTLAKG